MDQDLRSTKFIAMSPAESAQGDSADGHDVFLRGAAQEAIRTGRIPSAHPDLTWGGHGEYQMCPICRKPITDRQLEMEVEFAQMADRPHIYRLHVDCFAAWEWARGPAARNGAGGGMPAAHAGADANSSVDGHAGPAGLLSPADGDAKMRAHEFDPPPRRNDP